MLLKAAFTVGIKDFKKIKINVYNDIDNKFIGQIDFKNCNIFGYSQHIVEINQWVNCSLDLRFEVKSEQPYQFQIDYKLE